MLPKVSSVDQDDSRGRGSVDTSFYRVSVRVLVLKCRRTRLNSEVSFYGKDFICRKTHEKKKQEVKPKISGEKNVSTKVFRVSGGLRYESSPFVLRQY